MMLLHLTLLPVLTIQPSLGSLSSNPAQHDEGTPTITVRVYNLAEAPPKETVQARNEAGRIFKQAGQKLSLGTGNMRARLPTGLRDRRRALLVFSRQPATF